MRSLYTKIFSLVLLLASGSAFQALQAQQKVCGTDELNAATLQQHPEMRQELERVEAEYQAYANSPESQRTTGGVKTIPVVVHIIQASAIETVDSAAVASQIEVLNEDFRKMANTNGDGDGVDLFYEFCLASIDPNGCPTTGINRLINPALAYHEQSDEFQLKSLIQWDPNMYLNIWVPRTIETSGGGGGQVIGYARFPWFKATFPHLDGVVIHSEYMGRNASTQYRGRTTTHELGHYLGLFHTFQGGCQGANSSNCNQQGDRVCDTPQAFEPNFGNCTTLNSCTDSPTDFDDLTKNYMDYSNGSCQNMLTAGQKVRVDFNASTFRSQLYSAANLTATGCDGTVSPGCAPSADFVADITQTCVNVPVTFSDLSSGPATSWSWSFTGGTPATSTDRIPVITWDTPGTYSVTLNAINGLGNSVETKNGYITVVEATAPPLVEGFEGILNLPQGWSTEDQDQIGTWELFTQASSEGQNSMVMSNFEAENQGAFDNLTSSSINFGNTTGGYLTFDHCYKRYSAFNLDTLKVRVSTDCGASWKTAWERAGVQLVTVAGFELQNPFVPTMASQWVLTRLLWIPLWDTAMSKFSSKTSAVMDRTSTLTTST